MKLPIGKGAEKRTNRLTPSLSFKKLVPGWRRWCFLPLLFVNAYLASGQLTGQDAINHIKEKFDTTPYEWNKTHLDLLANVKPSTFKPDFGKQVTKEFWPLGFYFDPDQSRAILGYIDISKDQLKDHVVNKADLFPYLRFDKNYNRLLVYDLDKAKATSFYLYGELYNSSKPIIDSLTLERKDTIDGDLKTLFEGILKLKPSKPCNNLIGLRAAINRIDSFYKTRNGKFLNQLFQTSLMRYSPVLTGGKFSLNPLGFTDKDLLKITSSSQDELAVKFDTLVRQKVECMVKNGRLCTDTVGLASMKRWLLAFRTGNEQFVDPWVEKMKKQNESRRAAFMDYRKLENLILFHKEDCTDSRFFDINFENPQPNLELQKIPDLDRREERFYYIHNVPKKNRLFFSDKPTEIKNQSGFEVALEKAATEVTADLISGIAPLAGALSLSTIEKDVTQKFNVPSINATDTQYENVVLKSSTIKKMSASKAKARKADVKKYFSEEDIINYIDDLKQKLQASCKFDSTLFEQLTKKLNAYEGKESTIEANSEIKNLVNSYESSFDSEMDKLIKKYNDLLSVYQFQDSTFRRSGIPPNPKNLVLKDDDTLKPKKRTEIRYVSEKEKPQEYKINIWAKDGRGDSSYIARYKYKTGERIRFGFSIGFSIAMQDYYLNSVEQSTSGPVLKSKQQDRLKLMIALHYYPFCKGMLPVATNTIQSNSWFALSDMKMIASRISFLGGVGSVTAPLDNLYLGASLDIVPGFKISAGPMWFKDKKFEFLNNQVSKETPYFKNTWFVGITLSPSIATSLLRIF